MTSKEIRARVDSFWLNSLEAELLACIAYALADVADSLEDIRQHLQAAPSHLGPRDQAVLTRELQPTS